VDRRIPVDVFKSEFLARVIAGIRRMTPYHEKKKSSPMTLDILNKFGAPVPGSDSIDDLNITVAAKIAFAGFLRSGEFMYDDRGDRHTFINTKLTRSDVTFGDNDEHVRLRLKRSKTDDLHQGVDILLAATGDHNCPVQALRLLWLRDPQEPYAPLFKLEGRPFSYSVVVPLIQARLRRLHIPDPSSFTGHCLRRGAAQHASDMGLLESDIQALGRWSSQAFKAYFKTSPSQRLILSKRFLTGRSPTLSTYT
jgi:hypothetical protein